MKKLLLAVVFVTTATTLVGVSIPASAAEPVNQCNYIQNVGGEGVECTVTVTNTVNLATNTASSVVVIESCSGAARTELTCVTNTLNFQEATLDVNQCNNSGNGGGSVVTCRVEIINNITGESTPISATVNQCNDSGAGGGTEPVIVCDPEGSTTNATVTQCNGSGNGGGSDMRVLCTVGASTATAAVPVKVTQCNDSANGGGAVIVCTTSITNNVIPVPVVTPTPTPTTPPVVTPTPEPTTPPVVTPPVVTPPVVTPPVVTPPVVTPPVVTPPVVTPPVVTPPVVTPPVVTPEKEKPLTVVPSEDKVYKTVNSDASLTASKELASTGTNSNLFLAVAGGMLALGVALIAASKKQRA